MSYRVTWDMQRGRLRSNGQASLDGADMSQAEAWEIIRANGGNLSSAMKELECRNAAKAASASLEAQTFDLAKNWKPTGFYSPADLEKVLQSTFAVLNAAGKSLDAQSPPTETSRSLRGSISYRFGEAQVFVAALNEAKAKGITIIDAPGLKRWVIKAMNEAQLAHEHLAYTACHAHWAITAGMTLLTITITTASVIRTVVGVVADVGKVILKVPDTLGDLYRYATWGAVIAGGIWIWSQRKRAD